MKNEKEKSVKLAAKILIATKGKENSPLLLNQIFDRIEKLKK